MIARGTLVRRRDPRAGRVLVGRNPHRVMVRMRRATGRDLRRRHRGWRRAMLVSRRRHRARLPADEQQVQREQRGGERAGAEEAAHRSGKVSRGGDVRHAQARRSRRLLLTTLTLLNAIAALARIGLRRIPNAG